MRHSFRLLIAILILGTTFAADTLAHAQAPQAAASTILSAVDPGFRVDQKSTREKGKLAGTWVVRVNGEWVEPESVPIAKRLTMK